MDASLKANGRLDTMVCTGCCATLDHIVTYLFKKVTNKGEGEG